MELLSFFRKLTKHSFYENSKVEKIEDVKIKDTHFYLLPIIIFLMKNWNVNAIKKKKRKKRTSVLSLNSKHNGYFTTGTALAEV